MQIFVERKWNFFFRCAWKAAKNFFLSKKLNYLKEVLLWYMYLRLGKSEWGRVAKNVAFIIELKVWREKQFK